MNGPTQLPTEADAVRIIDIALGEKVRTIRRFPTGLTHFVFDVITEGNRNVVVRIAHPTNREDLAGAVYWSQRLHPLGIPLPGLLFADVEARQTPFPAIIIGRLPGMDLGYVYRDLTDRERRALAGEIAEIQEIVGTLPQGKGYGYAHTYDAPSTHSTWSDVITTSLQRSRTRIIEAGIVESTHVDRVERIAPAFGDYFAGITSRPFLDDITTKNVIVHNGRLSGIVDVDEICFGDSLLTIALTRASLMNQGHDLDYIAYWCDRINYTDRDAQVLEFYTALFFVDFMSEIGHAFNRFEASPVERAHIAHLVRLLDGTLARLE